MTWTYEKFKGNGAIYAFCPKCGFYKGADTSKKVVETKVTEEKAPKKAKASKKTEE